MVRTIPAKPGSVNVAEMKAIAPTTISKLSARLKSATTPATL